MPFVPIAQGTGRAPCLDNTDSPTPACSPVRDAYVRRHGEAVPSSPEPRRQAVPSSPESRCQAVPSPAKPRHGQAPFAVGLLPHRRPGRLLQGAGRGALPGPLLLQPVLQLRRGRRGRQAVLPLGPPVQQDHQAVRLARQRQVLIPGSCLCTELLPYLTAPPDTYKTSPQGVLVLGPDLGPPYSHAIYCSGASLGVPFAVLLLASPGQQLAAVEAVSCHSRSVLAFWSPSSFPLCTRLKAAPRDKSGRHTQRYVASPAEQMQAQSPEQRSRLQQTNCHVQTQPLRIHSAGFCAQSARRGRGGRRAAAHRTPVHIATRGKPHAQRRAGGGDGDYVCRGSYLDELRLKATDAPASRAVLVRGVPNQPHKRTTVAAERAHCSHTLRIASSQLRRTGSRRFAHIVFAVLP